MLIFLAIIVGIPLYLYFFQKDLINEFSSMENVHGLFEEYKTQGIFFLYRCSGTSDNHMYHTGAVAPVRRRIRVRILAGVSVLSLIGALVGTVLTYYIAKVLGHDAMHLIFGEEKFRKMVNKLNSKKP